MGTKASHSHRPPQCRQTMARVHQRSRSLLSLSHHPPLSLSSISAEGHPLLFKQSGSERSVSCEHRYPLISATGGIPTLESLSVGGASTQDSLTHPLAQLSTHDTQIAPLQHTEDTRHTQHAEGKEERERGDKEDDIADSQNTQTTGKPPRDRERGQMDPPANVRISPPRYLFCLFDASL